MIRRVDSISCKLIITTAVVTLQITSFVSICEEDKFNPPLWIRQIQADEQDLRNVYLVEATLEGFQRYSQLLHSWINKLENVDVNSLSVDQTIDWLLLRTKLFRQLSEIEDRFKKDQTIKQLLPGYFEIASLEQERRLKHWIDPKAAANKLYDISQLIESTKSHIEQEERLVPYQLKSVIEKMERAKTWLEQWYRFRADYDPEFTWWVKVEYERLCRSINSYIELVRKKLKLNSDAQSPIIGEPVGREMLMRQLKYEWIPYTPEELIEIGKREYDWCINELKQTAAQLGCEQDWKKALRIIVKNYLPPGQQPEWIKHLALEAIAFVEQHNLVSVPELCKESWRIEMMSPTQQRINPYFTGGRIISVSYPTGEMDFEEKLMSMFGNNKHFTRATVLHELIPGHWLQEYMANRSKPYRQYFETPFYIEGWALHWEMRFWDLGFHKDPADKIAALFWRLHRCARIIFSIKYHLGQMSEEEAVEFLIKEVGHEPRNAKAEVRRSVEGLYPPLYQLAYMIGGLQLRALHEELVNKGKMKEQQFHDTILKEGPIPFELIRAKLLGLKLNPTYTPMWRFYDIKK